jgi:hypothetical protein
MKKTRSLSTRAVALARDKQARQRPCEEDGLHATSLCALPRHERSVSGGNSEVDPRTTWLIGKWPFRLVNGAYDDEANETEDRHGA